ncbi:MAG: hypothetical protein HYZ73_02530 [Elusimicrobia bacterium]|nr:hypothetical protein [Elusimicrobiota bacterium]
MATCAVNREVGLEAIVIKTSQERLPEMRTTVQTAKNQLSQKFKAIGHRVIPGLRATDWFDAFFQGNRADLVIYTDKVQDEATVNRLIQELNDLYQDHDKDPGLGLLKKNIVAVHTWRPIAELRQAARGTIAESRWGKLVKIEFSHARWSEEVTEVSLTGLQGVTYDTTLETTAEFFEAMGYHVGLKEEWPNGPPASLQPLTLEEWRWRKITQLPQAAQAEQTKARLRYPVSDTDVLHGMAEEVLSWGINEAFLMLEEGWTPKEIRELMGQPRPDNLHAFGFPKDLFVLFNDLGPKHVLEVLTKTNPTVSPHRKDQRSQLLAWLAERNELFDEHQLETYLRGIGKDATADNLKTRLSQPLHVERTHRIWLVMTLEAMRGMERVLSSDRPEDEWQTLTPALLAAVAEQIDSAVRNRVTIGKAPAGWPEAKVGPLRWADWYGVENISLLAYAYFHEHGGRFIPPRLLTRMVSQSDPVSTQRILLGKATGQGFYPWTKEEALESGAPLIGFKAKPGTSYGEIGLLRYMGYHVEDPRGNGMHVLALFPMILQWETLVLLLATSMLLAWLFRMRRRVPSQQPVDEFDQSSALQISGKRLTREQRYLLHEALRTYFDDRIAQKYGFDNHKDRIEIIVPGSDLYKLLDPEEVLASVEWENLATNPKRQERGARLRVFPNLLKRMNSIAEGVRGVTLLRQPRWKEPNELKGQGTSTLAAWIPWGLLSHVTQDVPRHGANINIIGENLSLLVEMAKDNPEGIHQWAKHEAWHLRNPPEKWMSDRGVSKQDYRDEVYEADAQAAAPTDSAQRWLQEKVLQMLQKAARAERELAELNPLLTDLAHKLEPLGGRDGHLRKFEQERIQISKGHVENEIDTGKAILDRYPFVQNQAAQLKSSKVLPWLLPLLTLSLVTLLVIITLRPSGFTHLVLLAATRGLDPHSIP